jgi:serine/threonine protein phosphatase PrpC
MRLISNFGPYYVLLAAVLLTVILLIIRSKLNNVRVYPRVLIGNAQYIGTREEQEDSFATVENNSYILSVLADGMGGYANGRLASNIVVDTLVQEFNSILDIHPIESFFVNAANTCNRAVLDKAKGKRMGSTLVSAIVSDGCLYWASIGDSAIVLFKDGELINLNKKHLYKEVLESKFISGEISEKQLLNDPMKKRLYSYIGIEVLKDIETSKKPIKLRVGDKVLLCSDGVYNTLSEIEMESILRKPIHPINIAEEIIDAIKAKNYLRQDNATVIVLSCC